MLYSGNDIRRSSCYKHREKENDVLKIEKKEKVKRCKLIAQT